jgi:cell division septation protein DedD
VSNRTTVSRILFVSVGCLFVAAAAVAGMRLRSWAPADACLFCVTPEADATSTAALDGRATAGANGLAANHAGAGGGFTASALPPTAVSTNGSTASGRVSASGSRRSWQPWGNASGSLRSYSGNSGAPSASRGGLWRLMNLTRPGSHGTQEATVAQNLERPAPQVRAPRKPSSPAPPAAKPSAPSATAPPAATPPASPDPLPTPTATPAPPAPPTAFVPPTDPFHEHDKPLPDPFAAPAPNGPLDPGSNGPGPGLPGGRDPSPTPEPGSIFLIGTGLVGIFGALRQRRLL